MIHRYIFHNDKILPVEDARLSPGQVGYLCGYGIFTTLRITQGEAFAFERHWHRLEKDAAIMRLPMPYTAETVRDCVLKLSQANSVTHGTARIYFVQNVAGFWRSEEPQPATDFLLCTAPPPPKFREPSRLSLRRYGRYAASPLAGVKTISWMPNVLTLSEANKENFDEVILLNEREEVAECTAANIFVLQDGKICTPPLASGCLEGVTRSVLMEIAPQGGFPVVEKVLFPEDLYRADEVFITSSNRNVVGVGEIAGHFIANAPGPVTQQLDRLFEEYILEYVERRRATPR